MNSWTFSNLWNKSLEMREERKIEPRSRLWASELGGSAIDLWLKLKGTVPTNPPNQRSLRKFEAGNLWEAIVGHVLQRAGILISKQKWLMYQYDGLLPVSGKLDYIAGGNIDWAAAKKYASEELDWMPEVIKRGTLAIIDGLQEQFFMVSLKEIVLEIKSCSSFMFDVYEATNKPSPQHELQAYHYLKATNMEEAHIVYVCKDDCRMLELPIFLGQEDIEAKYKGYISMISEMVKNDVKPPLESLLVLTESGKVSSNWKVEYSQYLSMLYNFNTPMDYRFKVDPLIGRFNRVLGRLKESKDLTEDNKKALQEMKLYNLSITYGHQD